MRIIFAGTPEFAAVALAQLLTTQHEIVAVYTQPDRPAGRGRKLTASPVKQLAEQHGLPVYQPLHFKANSEDGLQAQRQLALHQADLMVVAAYGLLLPQTVLELPRYGCLNIHASLLPRWRGAAPIQRAILAGDTQSGVTIMQMAKGLDTGDMLLSKAVAIEHTTTAQDLHDQLAQLGALALLEVIQAAHTLQHYQSQRHVQDDKLSCYATKLAKQEAKIDWTQEADYIDRQIRAFNPTPIAYTELSDGTTLRIWTAQPCNTSILGQCGEIIAIDKQGVVVSCGTNVASGSEQRTAIRLTGLQWPGGKPLNAVQIYQTQKLQLGQLL